MYMDAKDMNDGKVEYKGEEPPDKPPKHCCSVSRCQCIIVVIVFVALVVIVGVLAGLLATKEKCNVVDTNPETAVNPWEDHRLPVYIVPDHYDLTLFPDFYDGHDTFTGNVTITLNVTMATRYILVHIRDLTVTRTRLMRDGNEVSLKDAYHYAENEYWVIEADDVITVGQVQVAMGFGGSLVNGIVGLYKSRYVDSRDNATKYIATSKFQPTDARKAFPCLDEPGLKSTFTTTLIHKPDMTPLSNMPVESSSPFGSGLVATHFEKSVPMVTYLKCFIVCDFKAQSASTSGGVPFKVWATPDKVDQVTYALDIGVKILEKYEDYYGLKYPLPKMDMIAIPDFVSGAMEHWGLITYRETNLLYDEQDASLSNKQRVAVVIAHELAHMWFGNLVTMEWWDDLWLNEGFASYVEYIGVAHVEKNWDMDDVFVTSDLQRVMPDDSKISSHPIIVPVDHPSEITEVFDSISYSKGASVLRMLDSFMGSDSFLTGLQAYMQEYQFKTTVTDDLWAALEKVDGAPPVKEIMDTWTRQMGFPVVTVTSIQGSKVTLKQERFLLDPEADKTQPPSHLKYKWRIPIRYQTSATQRSDLMWMNDDQFVMDASTDLTTGWIKLNVQQEGYYRVNYPVDMWRRLANLLDSNHQVLSPSDRSGLVDDLFNLASAKLTNMSLALDLIKYMDKERHLVPWTTVSTRLQYITEMMVTGVHFEKWQTFVRDSASPVLSDIAYRDNGTDLERQLRGLVINLACSHGDTDCLDNMKQMFETRLQGVAIPPNIRSSVYRFGMQALGDETTWDYMWAEYNKATVPQEKRRLLYAVTQTREPWLINRLLAYSMDSTKVRDQDFFTVITYLSWNRVAHPIVWNFARANWNTLVTRFDIDNRYLGRMVPTIVNYFNTENQLQEVKEFFSKNPEAGAGARAREQALEQIQNNIAWMTANQDTIVSWLDANVA